MYTPLGSFAKTQCEQEPDQNIFSLDREQMNQTEGVKTPSGFVTGSFSLRLCLLLCFNEEMVELLFYKRTKCILKQSLIFCTIQVSEFHEPWRCSNWKLPKIVCAENEQNLKSRSLS